MCTAATYKTEDFYFGRTLDYEFSYGDEVTITPRRYPFDFLYEGSCKTHYAIIGMAHVADGYPLYYDAVNEKGLCMAGLNFVGNAVYSEVEQSKQNIAQFELIPWVLGQCASVEETKELLSKMNLVGTAFCGAVSRVQFPVSQLHWMIADETQCMVLEWMADGMHLYENPVGVLTNNPPFLQQMFLLNQYMHLSPRQPVNQFLEGVPLQCYSRGMGAIGLPGDLSSTSRFVRAVFIRENACSDKSETESVSQFFHILGSVDQQRGCCEVGDGKYEITLYTSCCNATKGIYYYTTYNNSQLSAVDMHRADLESTQLFRYPVLQKGQILWQN